MMPYLQKMTSKDQLKAWGLQLIIGIMLDI